MMGGITGMITKMRFVRGALLCVWLACLGSNSSADSGGTPRYLDARQPIDVRVEDLLSRLTLAEKIGQINMPCVYEGGLGSDVKSKREGGRKFALGQKEPALGPGGGFFTLANTILFEGPVQQAQFSNQLQELAIKQTRLHVPLLQTEEGTHGLMCSLGTIFPEGSGLGSMC